MFTYTVYLLHSYAIDDTLTDYADAIADALDYAAADYLNEYDAAAARILDAALEYADARTNAPDDDAYNAADWNNPPELDEPALLTLILEGIDFYA